RRILRFFEPFRNRRTVRTRFNYRGRSAFSIGRKTTNKKGKHMKKFLLIALVASGLLFVPVPRSFAGVWVGGGYYFPYSGYGYYRPYYGTFYQPYYSYYYGPSYYWRHGHGVYYRHHHHHYYHD